MVTERDGADHGTDWITVEAAADLVGRHKVVFYKWLRRKAIIVDGRPLRTKDRGSRSGNGGANSGQVRYLVHKPSLERWLSSPILSDEYADASGNWIPRRAATKRFGISRNCLWRWQKSCPYLKGNSIRSQILPVGQKYGAGRNGSTSGPAPEVFYHVTDLAACTAGLKDDHDWVTVEDAARVFGVGYSTLKIWAARGCNALGGAKLSWCKRLYEISKNKRCYKRCFLRSELQKIRDTRTAVQSMPDGWQSQRNLEAQFGISRSKLNWWSRRGCCYLGGRKLERRKFALLVNGRVRNIIAHPIATVQEIVRGMDQQPTDATGAWLTAKQVVHLYGFKSVATLSQWKQKSWSCLGGRAIKTKLQDEARSRNSGKLTFYFASDIHKIAAAKGLAENRELSVFVERATVHANSAVLTDPPEFVDNRAPKSDPHHWPSDFTIDRENHTVVRGKRTAEFGNRGIPFKLVCYLYDHPQGKTRSDIVAFLWPKKPVTDNAFDQRKSDAVDLLLPLEIEIDSSSTLWRLSLA